MLAAQAAAGEPVISVDTKEEGAGRQLQERRDRLSPEGTPGARQGARFRGQGPGQGRALRGLRRGGGRGLGQRRHHRGHGASSPSQSIRTWLDRMARARYPEPEKLLITADCGGSNGSRVKLWKVELQKLADETGLAARGLPLPAGHLEVEQDRAPPVLPHHQNWRGHPVDRPHDRARADRRDHHQDRPQGRMPLNKRNYQKGLQGLEGRDGRTQHHRRRVPSQSGTTPSARDGLKRSSCS